jgi:hypothetical protein
VFAVPIKGDYPSPPLPSNPIVEICESLIGAVIIFAVMYILGRNGNLVFL